MVNDAYEFFFVVTPGLEHVVGQEITDWIGDASYSVVRGGVSARLPLALGLELNRYLKTPNRIILRLAEFGCRDFPKLFRKISAFAWEEWIGLDIAVEFSASSHNSRLRIKKRIEETAMDAWRARMKKLGRRPLPGEANERRALVLIRFNDDVCTISLDTSGEILHKRGMRELVAEAPLRETTAAALLLMLERLAPSQGVAPSEVELVDPMMGGGTFLIEARSLRDRITSRSFAFEAMEPLMAKKGAAPKLTCARPPAYGRLVGYEADEKTYRAACENINASDSLGEATTVKCKSFDGPGENGFRRQLHCQDFFYAAPLASGPERWLIANPPYGERLKIEGRLVDFYSDLFAQAERIAHPARACFLLPAKASPARLKLPSTWKRAGEQPFLNGGLAVIAHFFLSLRAPPFAFLGPEALVAPMVRSTGATLKGPRSEREGPRSFGAAPIRP